MSKLLCNLVVENKQHKQLIDRAKPDDAHLPFQQFLLIDSYYHFDLYGGILTKTLVEQRSIFLYLFFTEASKRNAPSSKSAMLVIRKLTIRWRDDNEDVVKKAKGLQGKTTTLHVHHTFSYISFYWGRKQATTKIYFSFGTWKGILAIQLQGGLLTFDKENG